MNENINKLIKEFKKIKYTGFIEGINKNKNAGGIILEKLLNCGADELCYPDYNGIEIKAIRDYDDAGIELFNDTPSGPYINTTQWLTEKYGYPDKKWKGKKSLKGNINAVEKRKIGLFNSYKLKMDKKRIVLEIYNYYGKKINEDLYWDYFWLKKKLETKLNYFALINTTRIYSRGKYYFNYNKMNIYKLKDFETFINLIKDGTIIIVLKYGYHNTGLKKGKFHDHGTSFRIKKNDLYKLFDLIQSV